MSSTKLTEDDLTSFILSVGVDRIKAATKHIDVNRRKNTDKHANFSCRLPRSYLDWFKHYHMALGSNSATRGIGNALIQFVDERKDQYPMLDQFGKSLNTNTRISKKRKEAQDLEESKPQDIELSQLLERFRS